MEEIIVKKIDGEDEVNIEEWVRVTDSEDLLGVNAVKSNDSEWSWQVAIYVAEFLEANDPLEVELNKLIKNALNNLESAVDVFQEDKEIWLIKGNVKGDEIIRACSKVLDYLLPETTKYINNL